jgi:hypothetical protein
LGDDEGREGRKERGGGGVRNREQDVEGFGEAKTLKREIESNESPQALKREIESNILRPFACLPLHGSPAHSLCSPIPPPLPLSLSFSPSLYYRGGGGLGTLACRRRGTSR